MSELPTLLVITDRVQAEAAGHSLSAVLEAVVDAGGRAIVVRERDLPLDQRRQLVRQATQLVAEVGGCVVVAAPPVTPGDAIHLTATDPVPASRPALIGRSCHHAGELWAAAEAGLDYATLSPIFPSRSKPGYGPPLGVAALGDAPLPTYALGGIDASTARYCVRAGAAGVAVMGAIMAAPDPGVAVAELLEAVGAER